MAIGAGAAVAAFLVRQPPPTTQHSVQKQGGQKRTCLTPLQGRAGLVAWRRSRGGVGAMGKAFYNGGFEPKMTKKEATLILSLK